MHSSFCPTIPVGWAVILISLGLAQAASSYCVEEIGASGVCSACPPGQWGSQCQEKCNSDKCMFNKCDLGTGQCTFGCRDGYYLDGTTCKNCPTNCTKCVSPTNCSECIDGRRGLQCQKECHMLCTKCDRYDYCLECDKGVYGILCAYNCSYCGNGCDRNHCIGGCKNDWYMYKNYYCVDCSTKWCRTCSIWDACETCVDGRWGPTCESLCSDSCHGGVCNKTNGDCVCKDQYYMDPGSQCKPCPENCASCTSEDKCTTCKDGYYGSRCENSCHPSCLACIGRASNCTDCRKTNTLRYNQCHACPEGCRSCYYSTQRGHTRCYDRGCSDGYYFYREGDDYLWSKDTDMCKKCPIGCTNCTSESLCFSCQSGYFPFTSICCPQQCTTCVSATECVTCPTGMYGRLCENRCADGCVSCSNGDYCNVCKEGRYSKSNEYRENDCACDVTECISTDGDGKCRSCKNIGWYPHGEGCCPCSKYCQTGTCSSEGICSSCTTDERYGPSCDLKCSDGMAFCMRCVESHNLQCIQCRAGSYLDAGMCRVCSPECLYKECDNRNGHCIHSCVDGWTGLLCDRRCDRNCLRCDRHSAVCTECRNNDGYFGKHCESECPENCATGHCLITGECKGMCLDGFWGAKCDARCGMGCKGICDHRNAYCSFCDINYHGARCNTTCSKHCVDPKNGSRVCAKSDGACLHGCEAGYRGKLCSRVSLAAAEQPSPDAGVIVGIIVGAFLVVLIIVIIAFVCVRQRRSHADGTYLTDADVALNPKPDGPAYLAPKAEQAIPLTTKT